MNSYLASKTSGFYVANLRNCTRVRELLAARGIAQEKILVDRDGSARRRMETLCGQRTVPQLFVRDRHVGDHDRLRALDISDELDRVLFPGQTTDYRLERASTGSI